MKVGIEQFEMLEYFSKLRNLYIKVGTGEGNGSDKRILSKLLALINHDLVRKFPEMNLKGIIEEMNRATVEYYNNTGEQINILFIPSLIFKLSAFVVHVNKEFEIELGDKKVSLLTLTKNLSHDDVEVLCKISPNTMLHQLRLINHDSRKIIKREGMKLLMTKVAQLYGLYL